MGRKKKAPQVQTRPITRGDAEKITTVFLGDSRDSFQLAFCVEPPIVERPEDVDDDNAIEDAITERVFATTRHAIAEAIYREGNAVLGYPQGDARPSLPEALVALSENYCPCGAHDTAIRMVEMFSVVSSPAIAKYLMFAGLDEDAAHFIVRRDYVPFQSAGMAKGASLWVRPASSFAQGQFVLVSLGPDVLIPGILVRQIDDHRFTLKINSQETDVDDESANIEGAIISWEADGTRIRSFLVVNPAREAALAEARS